MYQALGCRYIVAFCPTLVSGLLQFGITHVDKWPPVFHFHTFHLYLGVIVEIPLHIRFIRGDRLNKRGVHFGYRRYIHIVK